MSTHLSLVGVGHDGRKLLLVDEQGAEYTLDITPSLRSALRGQTTRLGQLEMQMSRTLRPRDIQDRIRGGESPEEVAEAAGSPVDSIMAFAAPVLAERAHTVERAQKSSLRRPSGDGIARTLGDAVTAQLYAHDTKPELVSWDSYRREDGRWMLTADYAIADHDGSARFVFDPPGNYVVADNEDARWLIGDTAPQSEPAPADDLEQARQRRLAAVSDELPLGDDTIGMVTAEEAPETAAPPPADLPVEQPAEEAPEPASDAPPQPPRRTAAKKRGRSSVPSWDEIMFGGSDK
jgi:hypothetical protein